MFEELLARWGVVAQLFAQSPLALLNGNASAFNIVGTASIVLAVLGVLIALVMRLKQALRLGIPALLAAVSPLIYGLASSIGSVVLAIAAFVVGTLMLILWVANIARDSANRRPPVWLIGIGLIGFALFGIMFEISFPYSLR